jgi:hypothetical protein
MWIESFQGARGWIRPENFAVFLGLPWSIVGVYVDRVIPGGAGVGSPGKLSELHSRSVARRSTPFFAGLSCVKSPCALGH